MLYRCLVAQSSVFVGCLKISDLEHGAYSGRHPLWIAFTSVNESRYYVHATVLVSTSSIILKCRWHSTNYNCHCCIIIIIIIKTFITRKFAEAANARSVDSTEEKRLQSLFEDVQRRRPVIANRQEDCSTQQDRWRRNSGHRNSFWCVERAANEDRRIVIRCVHIQTSAATVCECVRQ